KSLSDEKDEQLIKPDEDETPIIMPSTEEEKYSERIDNESKEDILSRGQVYLKETSYDAVIAAFKEAGKDYKHVVNGVADR
ncbi:MAG: hypothetical protein II165_04375, partial [Bacteroidales bacterium]|nr:hypothetical protein [Bacteroidales bacterium]